jgi:hypothetical protein
MIVFWNFNHFVVGEGFGRGRVYLNDPASGPRMVSDEEFDQAFTGVVLTFELTPEFKRGGERRTLLKLLGERLPGSRLAIGYIILATFALVLPNIVVAGFSRVFVDNIIVGGMSKWLRPLLLVMAVTAGFKAVCTYWQQRILLRLETKLSLTSSSRFLWHVLRLPMEFFGQRFGGEIGSRVETNDRVAMLLAGELATNVVGTFLIGFYAALMLQYNVTLTLISIAIAVINLLTVRYVARKRVDNNRKLLQERGKMLGTAMAGLQTMETLKSSGSESDFFSRWVPSQGCERGAGVWRIIAISREHAFTPYIAQRCCSAGYRWSSRHGRNLDRRHADYVSVPGVGFHRSGEQDCFAGREISGSGGRLSENRGRSQVPGLRIIGRVSGDTSRRCLGTTRRMGRSKPSNVWI